MTEPVELRTERLLLRPFRLDDVDDVFEYASNRPWARFLPLMPQPYTRRDAEEFVARQVLRSWDTNPGWAIVTEGNVIGSIALRVDKSHEIGELAYTIGRDYWGKGLMPEAARAVMVWGFTERGLAKVYAWADARNKRSLRVMEKLGMTREGVLRSHRKARDERVDAAYYGILREEWEEQHGNGDDGLD
jgi:RimJ/RimL family protein N-acetyltransferase